MSVDLELETGFILRLKSQDFFSYRFLTLAFRLVRANEPCILKLLSGLSGIILVLAEILSR